jgi:NADH dehydrogenase
MAVIGTSRTDGQIDGFARVYQVPLGRSWLDVLEKESVDGIVHCALDSGPEAFATNVKGMRLWLAEAQTAGVLWQVFLSSLSAAPDAHSDYGRAKYLLEQAFLEAGQIVLRLGVVVGQGGMFARIVRSTQRSPIVPLLDGGDQLIYVLGIDFLGQVVRGCSQDQGVELGGKVWHLQQPQPYTLRQVIESINWHFGLRRLLLPVPSGPLLGVLTWLERLPGPDLPVSSSNIQGLIQQGQRQFPSDYVHFGWPEESLDALVQAAARQWQL